MLVFQFVLFPVLVRRVGIMRLLGVTGVLGFVTMLTTPDIQRMRCSGSGSVLVAVLLLMVLDINGSVVSSEIAVSCVFVMFTRRSVPCLGFHLERACRGTAMDGVVDMGDIRHGPMALYPWLQRDQVDYPLRLVLLLPQHTGRTLIIKTASRTCSRREVLLIR